MNIENKDKLKSDFENSDKSLRRRGQKIQVPKKTGQSGYQISPINHEKKLVYNNLFVF